MLEMELQRAGYQVDVADDGEAGLITAAARPPAAAIIGLDVPVIDGCSLGESLREVFGTRIRLIALTPRDGSRYRARSRAAGFDVLLAKPVSPNQIHHTLRRLLTPST